MVEGWAVEKRSSGPGFLHASPWSLYRIFYDSRLSCVYIPSSEISSWDPAAGLVTLVGVAYLLRVSLRANRRPQYSQPWLRSFMWTL